MAATLRRKKEIQTSRPRDQDESRSGSSGSDTWRTVEGAAAERGDGVFSSNFAGPVELLWRVLGVLRTAGAWVLPCCSPPPGASPL